MLLTRWAIVLLIPTVILLAPVPEGVTVQGWRLLAVFVGTILGLMFQPLPLGAMALLGVAASALTGALTAGQALAGYAEPLVWMVVAAFCIARGMIKTGLNPFGSVGPEQVAANVVDAMKRGRAYVFTDDHHIPEVESRLRAIIAARADVVAPQP